jgi:hypothetical protein
LKRALETDEKVDTSALPSDFLVGYAPGQPAEALPPGEAKLIKAGSDIVFEVHYTPNGKAVMDRTKLGLVFAKGKPAKRVQTLSASNGTFKIPPQDPNFRVDASFEIRKQVTLASPHMHTRGRILNIAWFSQRRDPDAAARACLQLALAALVQPRRTDCRKGTRIEIPAHFDNSAQSENPDPTKTVIWSQQSWDEMMVGFFNLVYDADMSPKELQPEEKQTTNDKAPVASN